MKLKAGLPYPLIKSGLPFDYPKLGKNLRTDVIILGGGVSGALSAYYLIKAGVSCVVLDARSIGLGSTCASTSLLQYEIDTPLDTLTKKVGKRNAQRSYQLCAEAIYSLKELAHEIGLTDFQFQPSLHYALKNDEISDLKQESKLRQVIGLEVNFLTQSEVKDRFGFDCPGAILSELAASTNAYLLTHLLHQKAISMGLEVYDRTTIKEVHPTKQGIDAITATGFSINAKQIIYATGYESVKLINDASIKLKTTFAVSSEAMEVQPPYWHRDALLWSTGDPYLYLRSTNDRRIFIGGKDIASISPLQVEKLLNKKTVELTKAFNKLFPAISFVPEFSWAGVFASTKDGLPYIGTHKKFPHSFFALGYGGNGITFSVIAAAILTALVKKVKHPDAKLFNFNR